MRNEKTGILGNGDIGLDFTRLISNWTKDLTLFTNGKSALTSEQTANMGIFAIGDNAAQMRTVANAVAMGTTAGIAISKKMILEAF